MRLVSFTFREQPGSEEMTGKWSCRTISSRDTRAFSAWTWLKNFSSLFWNVWVTFTTLNSFLNKSH